MLDRGDAFLGERIDARDGGGLMVLVIEDHVGFVFVGAHEFLERARNRARREVGEHQAADLLRVVRNLHPARVVVVREPVDHAHHPGQRLGPAERRVAEHVGLEALDRSHDLGALDAAFVIGARDHMQFFRAREQRVDRFGRDVVIVRAMQERTAGLAFAELHLRDEIHRAQRAEQREDEDGARAAIGAAGARHQNAERIAHALVGVFGGLGLRQHGERERHHEMHGEDHRKAPEARGDAELVIERRRAQHQHRDADRIDDDRERPRPEQGVERIARGLLAVLHDREFFVIPHHELHAVRSRARRDQKRNRQRQRFEVDPDEGHEAQAPDRRQGDAEQRQCDAIQTPEIDDEQGREQGERGREDHHDLMQIGVDPTRQHRIAGDVNLMPRRTDRGAHLFERGESLGVIDVAFIELGLDERGLQIGRHQQAVDRRIGDHILLELLQLGHAARGLLRVVIRLGNEAALGRKRNLARGAMRQRRDQVVIDARQIVDALGRIVDELESFIVEDRAALDLDRHHDLIRAAEVFLEAVVDLDVRMILRQQIGEVGVKAQARQHGGEAHRHREDQREHDLRIGEDPFLGAMQHMRNRFAYGGDHVELPRQFVRAEITRNKAPGPPSASASCASSEAPAPMKAGPASG